MGWPALLTSRQHRLTGATGGEGAQQCRSRFWGLIWARIAAASWHSMRLAWWSSGDACGGIMEACCGAHHLGRLLAAQGHTVRLMSPEYVRPYVKAQKNDDRDA